MNKFRVSLLKLFPFVALSLVTSNALGTENGDTNWPLGVQTVVPALLPTPGNTQFYSYTVHYGADEFRGDDGDSVIPGFRLDNYVQALRFIHTWDVENDYGIKFSSGVIASGNHLRLKAFGQEDSATGLRQLYITPLYLTYSPTETLHLLTGFSFFVPIGDYDETSLANTTTNYSSYTHEFALTWFPNRNWELSVAPTIHFNQENDDTDYKSGNLYNVEFLAGYRFESMPQLQVGLAGYYTKQFSDDEISGVEVPGGNRLEKTAFGPQLFYSFSQNAGIVFKWLKETDVSNGPEGEALWIQASFPL